MENNNNTLSEGMNSTAETKTFTQEDVNRIIQERLAKEKSKSDTELQNRMRELDVRERKLNAVQQLRDKGLPDYLVEALNMDTEESFNASMEAIIKMKNESKTEEPKVVGYADLIGRVGGSNVHTEPLRAAFGLE